MRTCRRFALSAAFMTSLLSTSASACSCEEWTLEEKIANATYVFLADTTGALVLDPELEDETASVAVTFIDPVPLKGGDPPFSQVMTPYGASACGSTVAVPAKRWFFVHADGWFYSCEGPSPEQARVLLEMIFPEILRAKRSAARELVEKVRGPQETDAP